VLAAKTISKTELARHTGQVVDRVRRGHMLIVESNGEEQVAVVDVLDYRLLQAVATYYTSLEHSTQTVMESDAPRGLSESMVQEAVAEAGDVQAAWNCVIGAYLGGDISLGRASQLLKLSRFELTTRFNRLGLPLQQGPTTAEDALDDLEALQA
jgi:prevent-host-death family protein